MYLYICKFAIEIFISLIALYTFSSEGIDFIVKYKKYYLLF